MTAAPAIVAQPTGDLRAKGAQLQPNCSLCRESSRSQVWLPVLLVSFVSAYACAASVSSRAGEAKDCLANLTEYIEKSDAMLYAPKADDIQGSCKNVSLRCYILELIMVIDEEELTGPNVDCISDYSDWLPKADFAMDCPPCEAFSLENVTVFVERLQNLLQEIAFEWNP